MIGWGWLIAAFFLGDMMGIIVMAILYGSWSHKEEREEREKEFMIRERLIYQDPLPGNGGQKEEPPALQR